MSGHSKWAKIKHAKGKEDARKGKVFTKLIREIAVATREGGTNVENNVRLRKAVEDARAANMPQDNVKKAIQRGAGEIPGAVYEELAYEGYGPGGMAVIVEITTDNKNRTASELRKIFSQHNGNMGESGCVSWVFTQKGYIAVAKNAAAEDKVMEIALNAGAEDMQTDDEEFFEVLTTPQDFEKVRSALEKAGIPLDSAEITKVPSNYVELKDRPAEQALALMGALEEHEDVKNVYANFDIPKEVLDKLTAD